MIHTPLKVFFSYHQNDSNLAQSIICKADERFQVDLRDIEGSDLFALVASSNYSRFHRCVHEFQKAIERKIKVVLFFDSMVSEFEKEFLLPLYEKINKYWLMNLLIPC